MSTPATTAELTEAERTRKLDFESSTGDTTFRIRLKRRREPVAVARPAPARSTP